MTSEVIKKSDNANLTEKSHNADSTSAFVPLEDLSEEEIQRLLKSSKLGALVDDFNKNQINGFLLSTVSKDDLISIGLNVVHVTGLMKRVDDWNKNGVPSHLFRR